MREQVRILMKGEYFDYNTSHLRDELASEHGIHLSYASVYRLRAELGLRSPQKHKVPQHRRRRERAACMGQLVQVDGSDHDWLEERGPKLTLIVSVDDATGKILGATFREEEDTMGYMLVLDDVCHHWGRPQALYSDQHTIFRSPKETTLEQRLRGELPLSQFGRTLARLGIAHILARSPQAKGRVERLFGTLQDRLVKELRRHRACCLDEANRVLANYIPKYNQRFGREPASPESAFSPWPEGLSPEKTFACHYQRVVANDNTISFGSLHLPIPPSSDQPHHVRATVDVYLHYSGTLTVEHRGTQLASFRHNPSRPVRVDHFVPAQPIVYAPTETPYREPLPAPVPKPRTVVKPAANHPWRRLPAVTPDPK